MLGLGIIVTDVLFSLFYVSCGYYTGDEPNLPSTIYLCLKDDEPYIPSDSPSVSNLVPVAFLRRGEGGREKPREQGCCCSMYSVIRKGNHTLFARSRLAYQATLTPEGKKNIYIYI